MLLFPGPPRRTSAQGKGVTKPQLVVYDGPGVLVPATFFGSTFDGPTNGQADDNDAPPWIVGRSLDCMPPWADVETSPGVFNWTATDAYAAYHRARGRKLILSLTETPSAYARNQALSAYGRAGGGQVPTSLNSCAGFATAILQRHNAVSAANPTGYKLFGWVEGRNEPSFKPTGTVGENFCGTATELAQEHRFWITAARAADSSIVALSPGFASGNAITLPGVTTASMWGFLSASDGAGGKGRDWCDGVAFHGYDNSDSSIVTYATTVATYRSIVASTGADIPLYQTERGVHATCGPLLLARYWLIDAALGVRMSVGYKWDTLNARVLFQTPRDTQAMRTACIQAASLASGGNAFTITRCVINQDYSVTVNTSNGASLTI